MKIKRDGTPPPALVRTSVIFSCDRVIVLFPLGQGSHSGLMHHCGGSYNNAGIKTPWRGPLPVRQVIIQPTIIVVPPPLMFPHFSKLLYLTQASLPV